MFEMAGVTTTRDIYCPTMFVIKQKEEGDMGCTKIPLMISKKQMR